MDCCPVIGSDCHPDIAPLKISDLSKAFDQLMIKDSGSSRVLSTHSKD